MYFFKRLIFCIFMFPFLASAADSTALSKSIIRRNTVLFCANYGRQIPLGDLSQRFRGNNSLGFSVAYKFGNNWQLQAGVNTLFSGQVKENGILDSMIGKGGYLLDVTGTYAEVRLYERGYTWHVDIGKIISLGGFNKNSGLLVSGGLGFMQHKIKFTFQKTVLPQLESDYYKGYDRLTNGLMLRGFMGYQRIDDKAMFNFVAGIEYMKGFTRNRRSFNYDTRQADTRLRHDVLIGLKVGIMVALSGRQAGKKKGEEERYFE